MRVSAAGDSGSPAAPSLYSQNEALVIRLQAGDPEAAETLLRVNHRLLRQIAHSYLTRAGSLEIDDLLQEGSLGLLHAAELFDPQRGVKFNTYATAWIRQALSRAIANTARSIHFPVPVERRARKAVATGEAAAWLAPLGVVVASLDQPAGERGNERLGDRAAAPVDVEEEAVSAVWAEAVLALLPPRERYVLESRCGFRTGNVETLQSIGKTFGFTREGIRQVEKKALKQLREFLAAE